MFQIEDSESPINDLEDPNSPAVKVILYIYTLETFIYKALNRASRTKDLSKSETLGPYALALGDILLLGTAKFRKDIVPFDPYFPVNLYRGVLLSQN